MDVGDVIKTGLDNGEQVECVALLVESQKPFSEILFKSLEIVAFYFQWEGIKVTA